MRSCERPRKRSASEAFPSSVSNRYSLSMRTHGSSCRRRASSSLRRVSSFSASSSLSRAASHSSRVPVMCFVIALLSFSWVAMPSFLRFVGGGATAPAPLIFNHQVDEYYSTNGLNASPGTLAEPMLDQVYGAIADPTRRAILGILAEGEVNVGSLAERFP